MVKLQFNSDKDGFVRTLFYRKLSRPLTTFLLKINTTPIQATLISFFLAVIATQFFFFGYFRSKYFLLVIGIILMNLSYLFDCADGEIARIDRKKSTKLGVWLDGVSDRIKVEFILFSISFGSFLISANTLYLFGLLVFIFTSYIMNYSFAYGEIIFGKEAKTGYGKMRGKIAKLFHVKLQFVNYTGGMVYFLITLFVLINLPLFLLYFLSSIQILMVILIFYITITKKENYNSFWTSQNEKRKN